VAEPLQVDVLLKAAGLLVSLDALERGEQLAQEALALARKAGDARKSANALGTLGWAALQRDQNARALAFLEERMALLEQSGNAQEHYASSGTMSELWNATGEYERARELLEEALAHYQALGEPASIGVALVGLGWNLFVSLREPERGRALVEQGVAIIRELEENFLTVMALQRMGVMYRHQGKLREARRLLGESLALSEQQMGPSFSLETRNALGRLLVQEGSLAEAQTFYREYRALLPTSYGTFILVDYLEGVAALEAALGRPEAAARLWGAAEALREALGTPIYPVDRAEYAPIIAATRAQLGEAAFAAAWDQGRQLTPEATLAGVNERSFPVEGTGVSHFSGSTPPGGAQP
jgi:tetratricopeptide (TPR) repeat protein